MTSCAGARRRGADSRSKSCSGSAGGGAGAGAGAGGTAAATLVSLWRSLRWRSICSATACESSVPVPGVASLRSGRSAGPVFSCAAVGNVVPHGGRHVGDSAAAPMSTRRAAACAGRAGGPTEKAAAAPAGGGGGLSARGVCSRDELTELPADAGFAPAAGSCTRSACSRANWLPPRLGASRRAAAAGAAAAAAVAARTIGSTAFFAVSNPAAPAPAAAGRRAGSRTERFSRAAAGCRWAGRRLAAELAVLSGLTKLRTLW